MVYYDPNDIPVRSNSDDVDASWWNSFRDVLIYGSMKKYTKTYSDFSTAATTNDLELLSLAAKRGPTLIALKHSTAFSGGAVSALTLDVGVTGDLDRYIALFDAFSATSSTNAVLWSGFDIPDFSSTVSLRIRATSTGANLSALTAGSVDVWIGSLKLS